MLTWSGPPQLKRRRREGRQKRQTQTERLINRQHSSKHRFENHPGLTRPYGSRLVTDRTPCKQVEMAGCRDHHERGNMYNTQYRKFPSSTTRRRVSVFLLTQQQRSSQRNTENRPAAVLALARCPIGVAGTTMTTTVPCTVATGSTRHAAAAGPAREPSLARPPAVITSRMRLSPPIGPPTHPSLAGLWFVHWRHGQRCGGLCQERRRRPLR